MLQNVSSVFAGFFKKRSCSARTYMMAVIFALVLTSAFFLLFPSLFHAAALLIPLILAGVQAILFVGFAPTFEDGDDQKKKCRSLVKITASLFCLSIAILPLRRLQFMVKSQALIGMCLVAGVMVFILSLALVLSEKANNALDALEKGSLLSISGMQEVAPGDIVLCNVKEDVANHVKDPREILPAKDRFLHMLIIGPTGCGKTSQVLLPMILQDMQNPEWGVTVLEPKGDLAIKAYKMAEHFGRDVIFFDPAYKNCQKFNPLAGREVDVVENIATTFRMLNPDSPQFFLDLNEQLMRNAIKVLKRLDQANGLEGEYANFIYLSRLLQNSGGQGRELVAQLIKEHKPQTDAENKEDADICNWFMNEYFPERSKVYENTSGVRSQVAKLVSNEYLREVLNPDVKNGEKNQLNFDERLASGGVLCISTAQGALRGLSQYLGYFIILSLQSSVFRRPGTENSLDDAPDVLGDLLG